MKLTFQLKLIPVLTIFLLLVGLWCHSAQGQDSLSMNMTVDTSAIKAEVDQWRVSYEEAIEAGNLEELANLSVGGALIIGSGGSEWDSLRASSEQPGMPDATIEMNPFETLVLSDNWAFEYGIVTATLRLEDDANRQRLSDVYLLLFQNTADGWKALRGMATSSPGPPIRGKAAECALQRKAPGSVEGKCLLGLSHPAPTILSIKLSAEAQGDTEWSGTMTLGSWSRDMEIGSYEYADSSATIVRTPFGWFLPHTIDLEGDPPRLAWNEEPPPSRTDFNIIKRARELLSNETDWDRNDDRECSPSDQTYSLYCALAEATRETVGEYRHRQPALQIVRRTIEKEWPERLQGHRLMNFNNDQRTTYDDLIRALDLSEARLRKTIR